MPKYLDTSGEASLGIAICDRCRMKFAYAALEPDPNAPGLRVCRGCKDEFDPYRLPARPAEDITLRFPRPDVKLETS